MFACPGKMHKPHASVVDTAILYVHMVKSTFILAVKTTELHCLEKRGLRYLPA